MLEKNTIRLGKNLVPFFFSMHFLMSLPYLLVWACHWKSSLTSNILSSLPPSRGWWPQTHVAAAQAVILCCPGRTSQGTLTALFVLMLERKSQVNHFSYPIRSGWKTILKLPLLICCISTWPLNFLSVLAIQFLNCTAWRWKISASDKPFESCSSGKWSGGKSINAHKWREENCWACRSQTVHQPILQWLCLLESRRGNQHTVVIRKVRE